MLIEVEGVAAPAVTHAFVVGVSHYPFLDGPQMTDQGQQLGLANLSSAARSASELVGWLLNEYRCAEAPLSPLAFAAAALAMLAVPRARQGCAMEL